MMNINVKRVVIVYGILLLLALLAAGRILQLQFISDDIRKEDYGITTKKVVVTMPARGSILAADGRPLAFSTPEYFISMDSTVPVDSIFNQDVGALADSLAAHYHEKSKEEYVTLLTSNRAKGKCYTKLLRQHVGYNEMKEISTWPILCKGSRYGGLIVENIDHRDYPYGTLAYRTLGYLRSSEERPKIGIEGAMDSVLRGTPGKQPMRRTEHSVWIPDTEEEEIATQDGKDVQISIDIDMQDIAQRALLRKIGGAEELEAGTVVIMEVATGEIRAMVNMEKDKNGKFTENYNYAIGYLGEPGSVFKLATLVTALEDHKVSLDDIQSADVKWYCPGVKKAFEDHYLERYSTITIRKGFEISSNNVFRRIAAEKYGSNPQDFVDKLNNERRISYNFDFDIAGMGKARIRDPKDKYWSTADLPEIGMGYAVQLTPLHILSFYNSIANNGIMVKPHLLVNQQEGGKITYTYPIETIGRTCSEKTAALAKEAMRGVVTGENGTARSAFKDCKVKVAGKTGTARISLGKGGYFDKNNNKRHQGSFVGFFPYDNPKYSIIVAVWSKLTPHNYYGGSWGGPVAREIIDNIYASSPEWEDSIVSEGAMPKIAERPCPTKTDSTGRVPDVRGMGLRDATYLLESQGFTVKSKGCGRIKDFEIKDDCVTLSLAEQP